MELPASHQAVRFWKNRRVWNRSGTLVVWVRKVFVLSNDYSDRRLFLTVSWKVGRRTARIALSVLGLVERPNGDYQVAG
jgi:hypothetical protein